MHSFYDYFKVVADNNLISKNKWLIMWLLVGSGAGTSVFQEFRVQASEDNAMTSVNKVAQAFQNHYSKPAASLKKQVIINRVDCSAECSKQVINHEGLWHGVKR